MLNLFSILVAGASTGDITIGTVVVEAPTIDVIIKGAVQLALATAALAFFIMLLIGGFRYLTAGGDEKSTEDARKTLTNAGIGLIIVVASFLIAEIIFAVLGIKGISIK